MQKDIPVPFMGESIQQITIHRILVNSGTHVEKDDEIVEIETDKANQMLYAPYSGTIHFSIKEGDAVQAGQSIGQIDKKKEGKKKKITPPHTPAKKERKEAETVSPISSLRTSKTDFIDQLHASCQPNAPLSSHSEERIPLSPLRKTIASRLVQSQRETATLTTFNEIDLFQLQTIREKYRELFEKIHGIRLGWLSFFVTALAQALKMMPKMQAYIDGEEIVFRNQTNIGIAVSTEKGLVVPVLKECDKKEMAEIEREIAQFAQSAREGMLSIESLQGGGMTLSNGGVFGSLLSTPLLVPQQSCILGLHKIQDRPVAVNRQIVIHPMMYVALTYDHRLIDGKEAVSFLQLIKQRIEDPSRLLMKV